MDKKGQVNGLGFGLMLSAFVGIILGLVLISPSAADIAKSTETYTLTNKTYTIAAVNGVIDLYGQELIDTPIVTNATGGEVLTSGNYTIAEGVSTVDGLKRIRYTTAAVSSYAGKAVNVSYQYGMEGYIDDAGGRSIADLIVIFFALGIAAIALVPTLRSGVLSSLSR